jgi:DNA-binding NarL/FixJ family response regulator
MNANTTSTTSPAARPATFSAPALLSPAEVPATARRGQASTTTAPIPTSSRPRTWPVALLALPAFVAIWSGWVGLGGLTGFGKVQPLPGTPLSGWTLDTAITLPIGMEVYAAYALRVWLTGHLSERATRFARRTAIGALLLGAAGQVAYHLMTAAGITRAPWWITTVVACLPVAVLGMGAALAHLIRDTRADTAPVVLAVDEVQELVTRGGFANVSASAAPSEDEDDDVVDPAAGEAPAPPRPAPRFKTSSAAKEDASRPPSSTTRPTPSRQSGAATGTGVTVRRLRSQHPGWTVARIAQRAGVTERTVRRHLNAGTEATGSGGDAAAA